MTRLALPLILTAVASPPAHAGGANDDPIDVARLENETPIRFEFIYEFEVTDVPADAELVRMWVPMPRHDDVQQVEVLTIDAPAAVHFTKGDEYGNRMMYCELTPADLSAQNSWSIRYEATRSAVSRPVEEPTDSALVPRFLRPDALVPTDGFVASIENAIPLGGDSAVERARPIYDYCLKTMRYSKEGDGWGRGDVQWACDSRYGNCSDFHSVFISLCRARGIPARFEMGFPLPYEGAEGEIGGYHCWAQFRTDDDDEPGWVPVDVSEADKHPELASHFFGNLHARRVHFTTGRDITLNPKQDDPPLNFFIYPHVEVDGVQHQSILPRFAFENLVQVGGEGDS